jgi:hypothetical protein
MSRHQLVVSVTLCFVLYMARSQTTAPLQIGAFNIQVFGVSKMSNSWVVSYLIPILQRYDIVLIQEIRDSTNASIYNLLSAVNNGTNTYSLVLSDRLGRTSSKEQYAYMYNNALVSVINTFQFNDTQNWFERPPYTAVFAVKNSLTIVPLVGCHISPSTAVTEIDKLLDVYQGFVKQPWYNNIILMGDFNADCSYVPASQWQNIRFKQVPYSSQFTFVVPDGSDTTVSTNVCAYDRFVMNSTVAAKRVVPRGAPTSGYVYHFPLVYNMNLTDAAKISDHVPIEMTFMYDVNSSPTPSPTPTATTNSASDRKLVPTVTLLISLLAVVLLG